MSDLDRAQAEVQRTLDAIEDARRKATQELIALRAGEKVMAERARELAAEVTGWQGRAEAAVRAGDDALAKEALGKRAWALAELAQLRADCEEQATLTAQLLRDRRELDAKLANLRLRAGSVAAGLAAARAGGETPLSGKGEVWDRFDDAEQRIEEDSIVAELSATENDAEIEADELTRQQLGDLEKGVRVESALEELKARLRK